MSGSDHARRAGCLVALALALMVTTLAAAASSASAKRYVHVDTGAWSRCDFLVSARCLLPFPNDYFTARDRHSATGRRIHFNRRSMPANTKGVHIDPREYNRNDGFSPGQEIVVKVPGLDTPAAFRRSRIVPQTDMAQTYRHNQPVVVIDATTHRRHLIWAELDSTAGSRANTALLIRAGVNWTEGHRYIVALRYLRGANGRRLRAPLAFRAYRDRLATRQRGVERRRAHMESLFRSLSRAHIPRRSLYLAWDFTVASRSNLAGRMLAIRNDAFRQLGDRNLGDLKVSGRAPAFTVDPASGTFTNTGDESDRTWYYGTCATAECTQAESDAGRSSQVAERITGTFTVPCYLNQRGCPSGASFHYNRGASLPSQIRGNTYTARYVCKVPRASLNGPIQTGNRPAIYGHGLLGNPFSEINQDQITDMIFAHHFVYCATKWIGMANEDIPNAIKLLNDLSFFPSLADRVQQGMLDFLFLGRLEIHPHGFVSSPIFRSGGKPVIDIRPQRMYYDGNSQGGIIGGALTAVAPDLQRATLGVPGMNYSILLQRSVDFNTYAKVLYAAYPDTLDRQVYLSMLQMLWDRAEADGYAQHMTSHPYPDTPAHEVLMQAAVGDHQVANVAAEIEARTIGAALYVPALDPGRSLDRRPFYALPRIRHYPYRGSALVMFDSGPLRLGDLGTPPAPAANVPPARGDDPHEYPRRTATGQAQKSAFFRPGGGVIRACGAHPCYSDGWTGPVGP